MEVVEDQTESIAEAVVVLLVDKYSSCDLMAMCFRSSRVRYYEHKKFENITKLGVIHITLPPNSINPNRIYLGLIGLYKNNLLIMIDSIST